MHCNGVAKSTSEVFRAFRLHRHKPSAVLKPQGAFLPLNNASISVANAAYSSGSAADVFYFIDLSFVKNNLQGPQPSLGAEPHINCHTAFFLCTISMSRLSPLQRSASFPACFGGKWLPYYYF